MEEGGAVVSWPVAAANILPELCIVPGARSEAVLHCSGPDHNISWRLTLALVTTATARTQMITLSVILVLSLGASNTLSSDSYQGNREHL